MANYGHLREFEYNSSDWSVFKPRLENYFIANEIVEDAKKRAIFLNLLSESSYSLVASLSIPACPEAKAYADLIKIFNDYFAKQEAVFAARFKFYESAMLFGESAKEWSARVLRLASQCDYSNAEVELMVRDKFIVGFLAGPVRDRLFEEEKTIKLEDAVRISAAKMASFCESEKRKEEVHQVTSYERRVEKKIYCTICGRNNHFSEQCIMRNNKCHICNKRGHMANLCPEKANLNKRTNKYSKNPIHFMENEDQLFSLNSLDSDANETLEMPIMLSVSLEGKPFSMQLDTGAGISAISLNVYNNYFKNIKLIKSDRKFCLYNGIKFSPDGVCKLYITFRGVTKQLRFYVFQEAAASILGRNFFKEFKLKITNYVNLVNAKDERYCNVESLRKNVLLEFAQLFSSGLGTFTKGKITIQLNDTAVPKYFRPRPLPYAMREQVELELNKLLELGIIHSIDFSEWATPVVPVVRRDGGVRICGDYKVTVNPHIVKDTYPLPRIEDLLAKLEGGIIFSKLDLSRAYQQVLLDEESKKLLTISTHKGLFCYDRLPFGVSCAPSKFQRIIDALLADIPGCIAFLDDVLVTGKSYSEHFKNLRLVLRRLQECGFKLQIDKCNFFQSEVTYLGYKIDRNGQHTTNEKIEAIVESPVPNTVTTLKSFLGMINYYAKFIPNTATVLHPLYKLLKNNVKFEWSAECESAFVKVKKILSSAEVLVHFCRDKPIKLITDASDYGIGAVLLHSFPDKIDRPIAYASRTLNTAERGYSQIEKEALSIIFGLQKFYQYLYGHFFTLVTDHKPLLALFSPVKGIPQFSANRLRRWAIILSNFNYQIEYVKSEDNIADCFSRLPLEITEPEGDFEIDYVNYFEKQTDILIDLENVKNQTKLDPVLNKVIYYTIHGWEQTTNEQIKQYARYRFEFAVENECLLWNNRLVIPESLRRDVLLSLHKTHFGIEKMKSMARSYVWWPGLSKCIEDHVKSCNSCQQNRNNPEKVPLNSWPYPENPWSRIHIDYMGPYYNRYFLIVMDAHTKWLEVYPTFTVTSAKTIECLKLIFARFGYCDLLVSDNATAFTSYEFQTFLRLCNIKHITSPPYHPASNGAAENSVKTVKNGLTKMIGGRFSISGEELNNLLADFLFDYRTTKHCTTGVAPSVLMFGREIKNRFANLKKNNIECKIKICDIDHSKDIVKKKLENQKRYYRGKRGINFKTGDNVYVKDYKINKYVRGTITESLGQNSYNVQVSNRLWKRHANQISTKTDCNTSENITEINNEIECNSESNGRPRRNIKKPLRYRTSL